MQFRTRMPSEDPRTCSSANPLSLNLGLRRHQLSIAMKGTNHDLLRSQVRSLEEVIQKSPLSPSDFEWRLVDEYLGPYAIQRGIPALIYVPSADSFSVYHTDQCSHPARIEDRRVFRCHKTPGPERPTESTEFETWDGVKSDFVNWIKLLCREAGILSSIPSIPLSCETEHLLVFWALIHEEIRDLAHSRFEAEHFADAVEAALKHVNEIVKTRYRALSGKELDGPKLMQRVFSVDQPVLLFGDIHTDTGRSMQLGYMQLFAGAMSAIRNPKAHSNIEISPERAMHFLVLASLLRTKIDETTSVSAEG